MRKDNGQDRAASARPKGDDPERATTALVEPLRDDAERRDEDEAGAPAYGEALTKDELPQGCAFGHDERRRDLCG